MKYEEMNTRQRAEYLLKIGVVAKLDIDPSCLSPAYSAHVVRMGKLPCGYHVSEQDAVEAGTAWLREKAAA
jgi:hypothetical protein